MLIDKVIQIRDEAFYFLTNFAIRLSAPRQPDDINPSVKMFNVDILMKWLFAEGPIDSAF